MDSFVRELRYAFRSLARTPAFSAAAVLALAPPAGRRRGGRPGWTRWCRCGRS